MSPKNKGKFGKGKSPIVADTDEFLSGMERLIRWLKPHALKLGISFGVIAVVVTSYTTWNWWQHRKQAHATRLYQRAQVLSQVPVRADDDKASADEAELPPDPRDVPRHFTSKKDRALAELKTLDQLDSEYGSTPVAHQGQLLRARALYTLGRYDAAAKAYRRFADSEHVDELRRVAREGLGYSLEQKALGEKDAKAQHAGLQQALRAFESMQPDASGPGADDALFHQARVLDELGQTADAIKRFEKVISAHPDSPLRQRVQLRLLALKAQPGK